MLRALMWRATALLLMVWSSLPAAVRVWETKIVIPTYLAGAPELNPMFFLGRSSQGAQGPVYPYPMYDSLTGKKVDKSYTMVYLENEYLRIGVLPEIGGRIFEGVDKTNNYNFIYRQHVIKPALIGLIGAWISGGVEWNIPHHHRASTFLPVQYSVEENEDGSKTIWVGELEIRHRMRWAVGYTLRPGKAVLEANVRIINRTPVANSMLCFANLAVHTNENYQVIFPPSTQYGTFHAKREFTAWPESNTRYNNADFTKGVDISWYKNHIQANSVFAWNYEDDFFAGYDHGKQAGTMSVADHHVVPGKKFWTWGNGPAGRSWDKTLTDEDGPYIELMVGAYSDNQPDYSWLQPYETRTFRMNWYPFRDIGGVKKANLDAAVNLDVANGRAKVGFYTTAAHAGAVMTLKAGNRVLLEEIAAIDPGKPYIKQVAVPAGIDEHDLVAVLSDAGKELVSYRPLRPSPAPMPMPKTVTAPAAPADMKTNEELYLTGLRAQQFFDPNVDPISYWEEALRRDPADTRVNVALGITRFKQARYAEAEKFFRAALERLTDRYTSPKDGEAFYYLGATLKAQGKAEAATLYFYKATWSQAWKAAGYYALAELATARGDFGAALDYVDRSIDSNTLNIRAQNLRAAILRHLGRPKEALAVLKAAHRADPLDVRTMAETWLASKTADAAKILTATMNTHPATAQETAAEYLNAGLWRDGADVLALMTTPHPLVTYYRGYFATRLGQPGDYYRSAMAMPPDYAFPFQNEAIVVLRAATVANSRDARAAYYLGNLLYDWQPEEAMRSWEASAAIDPSFAIVHRNLAIAYQHQKPADTGRAIAELEKAISLERKYPLHFTELDELQEQLGTPLEKRIGIFDANAATVAQRDDAQNRAIALKVGLGKYDEAIAMMTGRVFASAEGANLNVAEHWMDAHIFRARKQIEARRYKEALADLEAAAKIPSNLPVGVAAGVRTNEVAYWSGVAYEGLGDRAQAAESWKRAADAPAVSGGRRGGGGPGAGAAAYYQGLALRKLGQVDRARTIFQGLVETRPMAGGGRGQSARSREAASHYLAGLGYLGLGDSVKAKAELAKAVEISPDLAAARVAQ